VWFWVSHACPSGQSVANMQPGLPHMPFMHVCPFCVQSWHVPSLPHVWSPPPCTHCPWEQHHPWLQFPLPRLPQSPVHAPLVQVGIPPKQNAHLSPPLPQAPFSTPLTHLPWLQQPPLQRRPWPQLGEHWCVFGSQAWFIGQSLGTLQPPPPEDDEEEPPDDDEETPEDDPEDDPDDEPDPLDVPPSCLPPSFPPPLDDPSPAVASEPPSPASGKRSLLDAPLHAATTPNSPSTQKERLRTSLLWAVPRGKATLCGPHRP
jgi:hypothetical protein